MAGYGCVAAWATAVEKAIDVLNLAHGEFYATGAYVAFTVFGALIGFFAPESGDPVLATHFGVNSFLVMLVAAIAVATVLAAVIGALSLRHTGLYFSLLTLASG